jgi:undecaprenyl-diphosphatase
MNPILLAATLGDKLDVTFRAFDLWVFSFFGSIQNSFLTVVAKFFTTFGDEAFIIPMVVLGIVLCFFKKTRKFGFAMIFAIVIGTLVTNVVAKPMFLRIRPYNTLQSNADYYKWYVGAGRLSESDYSFPSGHTTGVFELATALFLCFKEKKKKIRFVLPVIAVCTMGSRVYLMVHYATDVIGGLIVGVVSGVLGYLIAKLVVKIFEKVKFLDNIDLEKISKKGFNPKAVTAVVMVAVIAIFAYAFVPSLSEGGDDVVRCAYNEEGEYDCQNEARVDDEKYPPIEGKEYCKIHWKQIKGVE